MSESLDRRIQLRESIHQMVVSAATARCVSPAALVSMVVYDYLRNCGELELSITPPSHPKPASKPKEDLKAVVTAWLDEEEDDEPSSGYMDQYGNPVPTPKPKSAFKAPPVMKTKEDVMAQLGPLLDEYDD